MNTRKYFRIPSHKHTKQTHITWRKRDTLPGERETKTNRQTERHAATDRQPEL